MFSFFRRVPELLTQIAKNQEDHMAIGRETTAALEELRTAISQEADQAAQKIAEYVQSLDSTDQATADAIRAELAGVAEIIPNNVEDTDIPTTDTPADEPGEGSEGEEGNGETVGSDSF